MVLLCKRITIKAQRFSWPMIVLLISISGLSMIFYRGSNLYENWFPGKILEYKSIVGLKRFLDDFDYISIINDGVKN